MKKLSMIMLCATFLAASIPSWGQVLKGGKEAPKAQTAKTVEQQNEKGGKKGKELDTKGHKGGKEIKDVGNKSQAKK